MTDAELTFAKRMLPHVMAGMSPIDAAKAVMDDDARLAAAFFNTATTDFVPTADEMGRSHRTADRVGNGIRSHITETVYNLLRGQVTT